MLIPELTDKFLAYCSRHRAPATLAFYRTRLQRFCQQFNAWELASLTPLEIDEHLAVAGAGMSDSTRHHNVVALQRLQKFALDHNLIEAPIFGKLEKPHVGQRDRLPTADDTTAILARASPEFRLIFSALRQCGGRPGELCRATIADIDRAANAIVLREHKTARKTGKPRRIPIGRKLGDLLAQAIGERQAGPIFLSPAGKPWKVNNLSRTYSRLRDLAGLPRDLVLYLARHECGTKICREKGIEFARRLLGHANISTAQRYIRLDDRERADAQDLVE
jgi:integrase